MKMVYLSVLALAVLVLAMPVDAKPEKITIGPYSVSFDLGNMGAYSSVLLNNRKWRLFWVFHLRGTM
ncbi:MAG: hypothetical protein LUQ47_02955 [Methanotrichaceae archaeon]|nr:hypothetical protein [Methanotrichaceae archaeon]